MGCGSSKEKVCRKCQEPYAPARRTFSMNVRHRRHHAGESYHLVDLTSSTLGSLSLDPSIHRNRVVDGGDESEKALLLPIYRVAEDRTHIGEEGIEKERVSAQDFVVGMIEAKTWSKMIGEKIPKIVPKTPVRTPPGEPETINAWEMMEGLEDTSPLAPPVHHFRSFSFQIPRDHSPTVKENGNVSVSPKPFWLDLADSESNSNSNDTSIVSEFDPDVIATFRKSLEDLPPANPFFLKPREETDENITTNKVVSPHSKDRLVVYFTSLRGVRKTYEDCCHVRVILKGLGVKVDERDVSMHSGFKDELKELLLKEGIGNGGLPRVFVGNMYIGGAEEIRHLNEEGNLPSLVENCELLNDSEGGCVGGIACQACGDVRFIPCETCSGSCKIYYEEDDHDEEEEEHEYGFQRCPDCNENGLRRCPICCD